MAYDFLKDEEKSKKKRNLGKMIEGERELGGILGQLYKAREEKRDILSSIDMAEELEKEVEGEVLEKGRGYRIVKKRDEKTPVYVVYLPRMSDEDRETLKEIERRAIREITIEPESIEDPKKRKETFFKEVMALIEQKYPDVPATKARAFTNLIVHDMVGYGLLEPLLEDDALEEVMIVGTKKRVYVYHRKHGMCKTNIVFRDDQEIVNIIDRIARSIGRRIDLSSPLLDARLPDGSRVNATVPPVSLEGPSLTIRKFKADPFTVVDIINFGTLTPELAAFLWLVVEGFGVKPANILVSGGTGSGKTTTLNCLGSFIPSTDRVISIEDTAELQLPVTHWVRLETRPPNIEGRGEVSMDMLLKNTLRMRPDRIIVGEVRGSEAMTLLAAMNTGQNGCLGTIHANTAKETITRLTSAPMKVPTVMIPSLNLILMQNRFTYRGKVVRRITEIAEIAGIERGKIQLNIIYEWDPRDDTVKPTGTPSTVKKKIADLRGVSLTEVDEEIKRREGVLRYMIDNELRSIKDVGRIINNYYISPQDLFAEMEGRAPAEAEEEPIEEKGYGFLGRVLRKVKEGEASKDVVEQDERHMIIREKGEKNPKYVVPLPPLSKKEKNLLMEIEKKAISEIKVDPATIGKKEARKTFTKKVLEIMQKHYPEVGPSKRKDFADLIVQNMIGYGLLEPLLEDDALEEVMVVGTGIPVYVNHRIHGTCKTNISFDSDEETLRIIEKIASSVGRRIDKATPLLDARLEDGSRVNSTIPPISIMGPTLTIRKFRKDPLTIVDLINFRTLDTKVGAYLWIIVEGFGIKPGNILAAGGSGCGKTTTLNCLCSFIPSTDRVITIEDTAELHLPLEHCIRLETRPPNVEGQGEVTMDDLVKNTLRMRPDRIIVGEVRGSEARTLFTAMNTGHDGCMGTVHSNSARETIIRLTNPPMNVPEIMLPALDLILMQNKIYMDGKTIRRITEIAEVVGSEKEKLTLNNVYEWDPKEDSLKPTGVPSTLKQKIARLKGVSMEELEEEIENRERVLRWMVDNNIASIKEEARVFSRYYADPKGLLEEVSLKTAANGPGEVSDG
jgi:flagellar protein FlaI